MWRRWFLLGFLAPVLTFASTGCFVGGAEVFIADATVKPLVAIATTSPVVFIRFKYERPRR